MREYKEKLASKEINVFKELTELLGKLKRNEENVSKEVLETKYKYAYNKLKNQIMMCIKFVVIASSTDLKFKLEDDDVFLKAQKYVTDILNDSERMSKHYKVAFQTYSFEATLESLADTIDEIHAWYLNYWFSQIVYDKKHGLLYSTISKAWRINGCWGRIYDQTLKNEDGTEIFIPKEEDVYIGLPATVEEMKENYPEYSKYYSEKKVCA